MLYKLCIYFTNLTDHGRLEKLVSFPCLFSANLPRL